MNIHELRTKYREKILAIAEMNNVASVKIFGSVARGDAREDSDVDFLVELKPGAQGLDLGGFYSDVEDLLGKKIHVLTRNSISDHIKDNVYKDVISL